MTYDLTESPQSWDAKKQKRKKQHQKNSHQVFCISTPLVTCFQM